MGLVLQEVYLEVYNTVTKKGEILQGSNVKSLRAVTHQTEALVYDARSALMALVGPV